MRAPSEWAMERAGRLWSPSHPFSQNEIAVALDEAREQGCKDRDDYVVRSRAILVETARNTALDEAARACDQTAEHSPGLHANDGRYGARLCASSIRALKVQGG